MGAWTGPKFIFPTKRVPNSGSKGRKIGLRGILRSERKCEFNLWRNQVKRKGHIEEGFLLRKVKKRINDRYSDQDIDVLKMISL